MEKVYIKNNPSEEEINFFGYLKDEKGYYFEQPSAKEEEEEEERKLNNWLTLNNEILSICKILRQNPKYYKNDLYTEIVDYMIKKADQHFNSLNEY